MSRLSGVAYMGRIPSTNTLWRPDLAVVLAGGAALNSAAAPVLLHRSAKSAAVIAVLPLLLIGLGLLVGSGRRGLVVVALALPLTFHTLNTPHGGLWPQDIIVVLAIGAAILLRLARRPGDPPRAPSWPQRGVTGAPYVLFAAAMVVAAYRGHLAYGVQLVGEPVRLALYAMIGLAVSGLTAQEAHRGAVRVLYGGTIWIFLNALYLMATGGSQVDTLDLSTG